MAENDTINELIYTVKKARHLVGLLEANQTQSESGTTASFAAGCGPSDANSRRFAGWEPGQHPLQLEHQERSLKLQGMLEQRVLPHDGVFWREFFDDYVKTQHALEARLRTQDV